MTEIQQNKAQLSQPINFSFLSQEKKTAVQDHVKKIAELQQNLQSKLASLKSKDSPNAALIENISKIDFSKLMESLCNPPQVVITKKESPKKSLLLENIKTIYVDSQHLIFLEKELRTLATSQKKFEAVQLLSKLTDSFTNSAQKYKVVMVCHDAKNESKQVWKEESDLFKVINVAKEFKSSSDAFVEWATKQSLEVQSSLFVTSDKDLQSRLSGVSGAESINTMVPVKWLRLMQSAIGKEKYASLLAEN